MWRHFREAVFSDAASRILLRGLGRIAEGSVMSPQWLGSTIDRVRNAAQ